MKKVRCNFMKKKTISVTIVLLLIVIIFIISNSKSDIDANYLIDENFVFNDSDNDGSAVPHDELPAMMTALQQEAIDDELNDVLTGLSDDDLSNDNTSSTVTVDNTETINTNTEQSDIENNIDFNPVESEPMTKERVDNLESKIKDCDSFCVRKVVSVSIDNDDTPYIDDTKTFSDNCYYYNASNNIVQNWYGDDITNNLEFDTSNCQDSLTFLKTYLSYQGLSSDFATDYDQSKNFNDNVFGAQNYTYGLEDSPIIHELIESMKNEYNTKNITDYNIKYTVRNVSSVEDKPDDRIMYITAYAEGISSDDLIIKKIVTYQLTYF